MRETTKDVVLQIVPLFPHLEQGLADRLDVVRWFELNNPDVWLAEHAHQVRCIATAGHIGCDNALLDRLPALELIAINGVGFDKVDLERAAGRGVRVSNTPDVLNDDVADLAVGLVLSLLRRIPCADTYLRDEQWLSGDMPLTCKVSGQRFGVLGLGRIGSAIASRLSVFGSVAYTSNTPKEVDYTFHESPKALARASDVLIVATSANPSTRHLVDAEILEALGPSGYLINIARGSIVDENALIAALEADIIAGAALDVFADEPNVPAALRQSNKVVLTPHIASATVETRTAMANLVLANLDAVLAGSELPTALC